MCRSSAASAPESMIACWMSATSPSSRSGAPTRSSTASCDGVAAATARASSGVGLPSRRSPPTGLPVTDSSPNAPITSSRIWKASPSGRPYPLRPARSAQPRCGRGEHGAEVERPLDRVLAALVATDPLGRRQVAHAPDRAEDVEQLAGVELGAEIVPDHPRLDRGAEHELVGVHEREVADEDRDAFAEPPRLGRPPGGGVLGRVHGVRGRDAAAAGGVVHDVVVEQREGVHQLERRAGVDDALVAGVASRTDEAPVAERRPQALATRQHEPADLVDRTTEIGVEGRPSGVLGGEHRVQPCLDPRRDRGEARWSAGGHVWPRLCPIGRLLFAQIRDRCRGRRSPRRSAGGRRRCARGRGRSAVRPAPPDRRAGRRRRRSPRARAGCRRARGAPPSSRVARRCSSARLLHSARHGPVRHLGVDDGTGRRSTHTANDTTVGGSRDRPAACQQVDRVEQPQPGLE